MSHMNMLAFAFAKASSSSVLRSNAAGYGRADRNLNASITTRRRD
jgi:hypothetical protein